MLKNQDIICISTIDWDFIWQGHQEIMSTFAKNGNRVLFIENTGVRAPNLKDLPRLKKRVHNWIHSVKGIRKERENLYVYSPILLPFPYSCLARRVNKLLIVTALKRWIVSVGFARPVVWTFLPTGLALDIIDALDPKIVVYYCIDNFSASSYAARKIAKSERKLLQRSDMVFVTAKSLYDKCSEDSGRVHTFPFGVSMGVYGKALESKPAIPADLARIKRPVVGYVGGIHKWIDMELVRSIARKSPDRSFVLVGPIQTDVGPLRDLPNVHFLGQKRYEDLPAYVTHFDACIVPYLMTEYTKNVYPTKLNEYLSLGKPVISTAIPEVVAYNERNDGIVSIGRTHDEFSALVGEALAQRHDPAVCRKRMKAAVDESSWEVKIEKMSDLIETELARKEAERGLKWKDSILKLYSGARRKVLPAAVAAAALYIVLFHTPFVWWAASPLKIEDPLRKAGAIAVFAGGVGESGKAGQGYEERVKYAVELYKQGYADRLILSSGYSYAFKETDVMKALAVSQGIPENRIFLEDRAANTYENVVNTARIMTDNGIRSAIVITSPYNTKRVSLVSRRVAPDKDLMIEPVRDSIFFGNRGRVEVRHIAAILHEYLGIVYYKLKGYI